MTRDRAKKLAQIGVIGWAAVFILHMSLGYYARTSIAFALFPTWAAPLFYVAFRIGLPIMAVVIQLAFWAVVALIAVVWRILVPR